MHIPKILLYFKRKISPRLRPHQNLAGYGMAIVIKITHHNNRQVSVIQHIEQQMAQGCGFRSAEHKRTGVAQRLLTRIVRVNITAYFGAF